MEKDIRKYLLTNQDEKTVGTGTCKVHLETSSIQIQWNADVQIELVEVSFSFFRSEKA